MREERQGRENERRPLSSAGGHHQQTGRLMIQLMIAHAFHRKNRSLLSRESGADVN